MGRFWDYIQNKFPTTVIRSKGLFWLDSRPGQAISWSQAGGSLKSVLVYGGLACHMKSEYNIWHLLIIKSILNRLGIKNLEIEKELVFIGQEMDQQSIERDLDFCLATENELFSEKWKKGNEDAWPVQRVYPLE